MAYRPELKKSRDRYVPTLSPTEQFMELKLAYDVLRKPEKRREYDRELRWGRGELRSDVCGFDVFITVQLFCCYILNAGDQILRTMWNNDL